ncbi:hypothetical protein DV736_g3462, partial [Chaetothyriales sp. CBS 134916]
MRSPIIYQNPASTVVLLDLPRSLEDAQALDLTVRSTAEIEQPWPSTEPKGAQLERVLASTDPDVLVRDQRLQREIDTALDEVKSVIRNGQLSWLCPRSTTGLADHVLPYYETPKRITAPHQLDGKTERVTDAPPLILSTTPGADQFLLARQVQDIVVLNPSGQKSEITVNGDTYLIPASSRLLWSSILTGLPAIQGAASTITQSKFDLILMDPPWANRSVRRSKQYKTAEGQPGDPFLHTLPIVDNHLREDGVVAIWIANKPVDRVKVEATMQEHGLQLVEEWTWTKITSHGEPVTALDGVWRKPYETLLLFRHNPSSTGRCRRFIFAVPDLHSRKPSLKRLFERILPPSYQALELFARENNPEVMTSLVRELGLSPTLQFHDVFSLTEPTLLEFLPRPAVALLLVFPVTETYEKFRRAEDASKEEYNGSGQGEDVVWFKQTIRNACGLIGLLHSVTNGYAREQIIEDSGLDKLLKQAIPLKPNERADLLYNSQALEAAHATAAARGDSTAPDARAAVDLHFVAFVKDKNGNLWELDGRRKGPLNRGKLEPDEDVLSAKGQELGVLAFLKREEEAGGGELRFSVVMLGPNLD